MIFTGEIFRKHLGLNKFMMAEPHDDISGFITIRREIPASKLAVLQYDFLCYIIVWQKALLRELCIAFGLLVTQNPNNSNKNF